MESLLGTFTIVSPVIVHLRVCRLSMMISPAKGEKSLDILHSTGKRRGAGRERKRENKIQSHIRKYHRNSGIQSLSKRVKRTLLSLYWCFRQCSLKCQLSFQVHIFLKRRAEKNHKTLLVFWALINIMYIVVHVHLCDVLNVRCKLY